MARRVGTLMSSSLVHIVHADIPFVRCHVQHQAIWRSFHASTSTAVYLFAVRGPTPRVQVLYFLHRLYIAHHLLDKVSFVFERCAGCANSRKASFMPLPKAKKGRGKNQTVCRFENVGDTGSRRCALRHHQPQGAEPKLTQCSSLTGATPRNAAVSTASDCAQRRVCTGLGS
jgi:hypothetical protein